MPEVLRENKLLRGALGVLVATFQMLLVSCGREKPADIAGLGDDFVQTSARLLAAREYTDLSYLLFQKALQICDSTSDNIGLSRVASGLYSAGFVHAADSVFDRSLRLSALSDNWWDRAHGLLAVADGYAECKRYSEALRLIHSADSIAKSILSSKTTENDQELAWGIKDDVAGSLAKAGNAKGAVAIVREIQKSGSRMAKLIVDFRLREVALSSAAAGRLRDFRLALELMPDDNRRYSCLSDASDTLVATNRVSLALQVAKLELDPQKWWLVRKISVQCAERGLFGQALEITNSIGDKEQKAYAYAELAPVFFEKGKPDDARKFLSQALELSKKQAATYPLYKIARSYAEIGDFVTAEQIADKLSGEEACCYLLADIASTAFRQGETWYAMEMFTKAEESASTILNHILPCEEAKRIHRIAWTAIHCGDTNLALRLIEKSLRSARGFDDECEELKRSCYESIATQFLRLCRFTSSMWALRQGGMDSASSEFGDALSYATYYMLKEGKMEVAKAIADSVRSVSPIHAMDLLRSIAKAYAQHGQKTQALAIARESDAISALLGYDWRYHQRVLALLVDYHLNQGDFENALRTVSELPLNPRTIPVLCRVGIAIAKKS